MIINEHSDESFIFTTAEAGHLHLRLCKSCEYTNKPHTHTHTQPQLIPAAYYESPFPD